MLSHVTLSYFSVIREIPQERATTLTIHQEGIIWVPVCLLPLLAFLEPGQDQLFTEALRH